MSNRYPNQGPYLDKFPTENLRSYRKPNPRISNPMELQLVEGGRNSFPRYQYPRKDNYQKTYSDNKREKIIKQISGGDIDGDIMPYLAVDGDEQKVLPYTLNGSFTSNGRMIAHKDIDITPTFTNSQAQEITESVNIKGFLERAEMRVVVPKLPEGVTVAGIHSFLNDYSMRFVTDDSDFNVDSNLWYALTYGLQSKIYKETLQKTQGFSGIFDGNLDNSYTFGPRLIKANLPMSFKALGIIGLDSIGNGIPSVSSTAFSSFKFSFRKLKDIYLTELSQSEFNPVDYIPKITLRLIYHDKPTEWLKKIIYKQSSIYQDTQSAFASLSSNSTSIMAPNSDVSFELNFNAFNKKYIKMLIVMGQLEENMKYGPAYPKTPLKSCSVTDNTTPYFNYKLNASEELSELLRNDDKFTDVIDDSISVFNFALTTDFDSFSGCITGDGSTTLKTTFSGEDNNSSEQKNFRQSVYALIHSYLVINESSGDSTPDYLLYF